ncbi:MAG: tryptophanase [Kiritimatiellia bacterium]|jgi:tryptophanase
MSSWDFRTTIEPFRIKSVEPIPILEREERVRALDAAGHNLFKVLAESVTIDLLTDSGTGAMSAKQWGALLMGDESYAGSRSFQHLDRVVQRLTGMPYVLPCHQGRAAERILAHTVIGAGQVVISNTHFDTTRANVEQAGATAIDAPIAASKDPNSEHPFKGNMDVEGLQAALVANEGRVAMVILTITNNAAGGQPVSMANAIAVGELAKKYGVPFYLDAARFAENAWFIQQREPAYADWKLGDIARHMFELADGFTMSAKKDGIVNIGGLLATKREDHLVLFRNQLILGEGFPTYGGLAGRDLDAMAIGLQEALDPLYLRYRTRTVSYFSSGLLDIGMPVLQPPGGHAVYLDAGALLPHIPKHEFPGQTLVAALYLEGGVRGVELGSLMFPNAPLELVRLALPRRVYTQAHIDYVIEVAERVVAKASQLRGYRIVQEPPFLRHFTAELAPLG